MAIKADEIIRLRNEGMAYAMQIAKKEGIEGLEKQVKLRNLLKVSIKFTPEEINESVNRISERVYNNMLTIVYAVLHDVYGYGQKRLIRFKEMFERKAFLVGETDPLGGHYATFDNYAEEANRLYQLGIDVDAVRDTRINNDYANRGYAAIDLICGFLRKRGFTDAAEAIEKDLSRNKLPKNRKERLRAESRRESDRRNRFYIDDTYELNIEYWFNVFGLAMAENGIDTEKLLAVWEKADKLDASIAEGRLTLEQAKDRLLDAADVVCEFTKVEDAG